MLKQYPTLRYILNRGKWYFLTFLVAVTINFYLPRLGAGNPVDIIMAKGTGESATIEYEFYGEVNTGAFSWNIPTDAINGDDWNLIIYDHADVLMYDAVIGFEIISEVSDGDGQKPLIPGYNLLFLTISLLGMIIIFRRKWVKKLGRN